MFTRRLNLKSVLRNKSHFLFGPRAVGKSYLIRQTLGEFQKFDLLNQQTFFRFLTNPELLASEINSKKVVVDEIQKIPQLLDVVHRLIEEQKIVFLLTGSSARKIRKAGTNLLGGRARWLDLLPLTYQEITDFDMLKFSQRGGLPMIYLSEEPRLDLKSYCELYLKEEVLAEALVRRADQYSRFLDAAGARSGHEINFELVARDSSVPARTIQNYYDILRDTLMTFELLPFRKTKKFKAISKAKIYFFDVGVANYLAGRYPQDFKSADFGFSFEHFLINEIRAYILYNSLSNKMQYWRTFGGQFEVDCVIDSEVAIEIKAFDRFSSPALKGLRALQSERVVKRHFLISRDPIARVVDGVEVCHWQDFLEKLWNGQIF